MISQEEFNAFKTLLEHRAQLLAALRKHHSKCKCPLDLDDETVLLIASIENEMTKE